ncbi:NAD(P)/FAD-dependent oxidoreductase [Sphingobacterium yanglingense]|uniref:Thioredoxin reductase n=1 Tax=Sphingobacterium yanglingense TaxID=1437280 RepID=A0A4R6WGH7_9SPHI|nr:NAD(P)/FAD-dependent oxidoreductase [Sphingobacterium yanglingense]TDQ77313.1 thioredoxin reductase [Sphingobacterium yanglingense]
MIINRRSFLQKTGTTLSGIALSNSLFAFNSKLTDEYLPLFDVIIVGGSYSGLSAALTLGRSLRKVLVIDGGTPCNMPAPHSHNFLTQDGKAPLDIAHMAKQDVLKYPSISWLDDQVTHSELKDNVIVVETANGKKIRSRRILFATGLKDIMPGLNGYNACWGKSILHCPYCHGYEFKGKKIGIWGDGNVAFHYALLVKNYVGSLQIFTRDVTQLEKTQREALSRNGIEFIESTVKELKHKEGWLESVLLDNGRTISLDVLYHRPLFEQQCKVPVDMGCELTAHGLLKTDSKQQTSLQGIYACGDNSSFRSIPVAVATGSTAGAAINMDLAITDF